MKKNYEKIIYFSILESNSIFESNIFGGDLEPERSKIILIKSKQLFKKRIKIK